MTPADSVCKYCADVGIVSAIVDVHQLYAGREGFVLTVFLEMRFGVRTLHRHLAHTVLLQSLHHLHAYSVAVVGVMPMLVEQRNIPRVQKFAAFFLRRIRGIYINMVVWREAITHIQVVLQRTLQLLTRFCLLMCFVVGIEDILFDSVPPESVCVTEVVEQTEFAQRKQSVCGLRQRQLSSIQYHDESPTDPNRPGSLRKTTRRSGGLTPPLTYSDGACCSSSIRSIIEVGISLSCL